MQTRSPLTILATLDGSALAEMALSGLVSLSLRAPVEVTLLTVISPSTEHLSSDLWQPDDKWESLALDVGGGSGPRLGLLEPTDITRSPETNEQQLARLRDRAQHYLGDTAKQLRAAGTEVHTTILFSAEPSEAIIEYARQHQFHIIAMSTHARSGVNEFVHGCVTRDVLGAGVAPVLLVNPSGAGSPHEGVRSHEHRGNREDEEAGVGNGSSHGQ